MDQQSTDESQSLQISVPAGLQTADQLPLTDAGFKYDRIQLTSGNLIHAGASIALPIGKNISLGISEFYYRRQKQTNLKERSTYTSGVFYDSFSRVSTKNEGTIAVAGALLRSGAFSIGASVRIPRALSDKTDYETSQVIYTGTTPELSSQNISTHREDELTTRTWNLGIAWTPTEFATVSADVIHYPATRTLWAGSGGFDTQATTDWSFGAELRSDTQVIAGGAFTNSSLVRKPIPSLVSSDPSQINFVGFSLGAGLKTKQSENLFIMTRQRGLGYTQMVQGNLTLQDVSIETQTFSLSSSYKF
jgi:opacity protein-like surface antigen